MTLWSKHTNQMSESFSLLTIGALRRFSRIGILTEYKRQTLMTLNSSYLIKAVPSAFRLLLSETPRFTRLIFPPSSSSGRKHGAPAPATSMPTPTVWTRVATAVIFQPPAVAHEAFTGRYDNPPFFCGHRFSSVRSLPQLQRRGLLLLLKLGVLLRSPRRPNLPEAFPRVYARCHHHPDLCRPCTLHAHELLAAETDREAAPGQLSDGAGR